MSLFERREKMRRLRLFATGLLFFILILTVSSCARHIILTPPSVTSPEAYLPIGKKNVLYEYPIENGVIHRIEWRQSGPLFLNALTIDLRQPALHLEAEKGKDMLFQGEKVASIATRENRPGHTTVAAVNADFWGNKFTPVGLFVDDGTIYKGPHPNRSVFMMDKQGTPYFARVDMDVTLQVGNTSIPVNGINLSYEADAVLFTDRFGNEVDFHIPRLIFLLRQDSPVFIPNEPCHVYVTDILTNETKVACQKGMFILAMKPEFGDKFRNVLKKNAEATLNAVLKGFDKAVVLAVGGCPRILRDGKISVEFEEEKIPESFSTTKHPRTAIGLSKDKKTVYLVAVDGRQPSLSIGQSLDELAQYMKGLGAWDAINLDGGGSTTMWVRGEITNRPSDATGPRTVTEALLLVSTATPGRPAHICLQPNDLRIPVGSTMTITPTLYDEHYNALPFDPKDISWEITGNIGTMKNGTVSFAAENAKGKITVKWKGGELSDSISVHVMQPEKIEVKPDAILLSTGDIRHIDISAIGSDGDYIMLLRNMVNVQPSEGIEWSEKESAVLGKAQGKHALTIKIGNTEKVLPVYVDYYKSNVFESFDNPGSFQISMENCDKEATNIAPETTNKKEGNASLRLNYKMTPGGTSAIYLNLNRPIAGQPFGLGFWVYGDGREQWLRGVITDRDGEEFIADFTGGTRGVFWKDEWRFVSVAPPDLTPKWTNPSATLDYPITLKQIYLIQTRTEKKSGGSILLDAFTA